MGLSIVDAVWRRLRQLRSHRSGAAAGSARDGIEAPASDAVPRSKFDYRKLSLSSRQIDNGDYKAQFGGGAHLWRERGKFQLGLLRHCGLHAESRLLDVGCGPLRGGVHLLRYLRPGGYRGVDINVSLVAAAHRVLEREGLASQQPRVSVLGDFGFATLGEKFDFILCFSVLNHCSVVERSRFFEQAAGVLAPRGRIIVTHATWLDADMLQSVHYLPLQEIRTPADLPASLAPARWGFDDVRSTPLPIVVFGHTPLASR